VDAAVTEDGSTGLGWVVLGEDGKALPPPDVSERPLLVAEFFLQVPPGLLRPVDLPQPGDEEA
jgi:hypothetical protein